MCSAHSVTELFNVIYKNNKFNISRLLKSIALFDIKNQVIFTITYQHDEL